MGARSKESRKVRTASEFDLKRLERLLKQPVDGRGLVFAWTLEDIYAARQDQMLGRFLRPARLAESMRTDDALAVAYENRLDPQKCIPVEVKPVPGARGKAVAKEAGALFGPNGTSVHPDTLADIHGCLVNHAVAFACVTWVPRPDGTRVDPVVNYWPIEYVRWDRTYRVFRTRIAPESGDVEDTYPDAVVEYGGSYAEVPIVHGDGRWIIFKKHEIDPFTQSAAIIPGALVWARHAFAARDWAKGSVSHGSMKLIGELPENVPLTDAEGNLTAEAAAFISLLKAMVTDDAPVGIRPSGAQTNFEVNTSTAWQVWSELILNAEKAAARIYLGTDGTLGATGGAPGVDISALFGVAATKVRGDLECIQRGIDSGVIEPWCALNFGDSSLAPSRRYLVPNNEQQTLWDATAKRNQAFYTALLAAAQACAAMGSKLSDVYIAQLAEDFGVRVPVLLPAPVAAAPAAGAAK